ncbi:hypothetical protein D3C76_1282480 [compost metagenome]
MLLDEVGLFAVEGDDTHRGALVIGGLPQLVQVLDDPFGFLGITLVLIQPANLDQLQRLDALDARLRVTDRNVQAIAIERGVGKADQFTVSGTVVDLQCGAGEDVARQLQQVGAVLDLTTVPRVFERFALLLIGVFIRFVAVEHFGFVAFDATGKECRRRHLLLIAAYNSDLAAEQGRQGELNRHL